MKDFRRIPNSPLDVRERALARLAVRPATHAPMARALDEGALDHTGQLEEERDDEVHGGWIPERAWPLATAPNAPADLNAATLDQPDALPDVGPVLAERIVDYRTQTGPFTIIVQLQEVPGVGPTTFDSLKSHVRI